VTYGPRQAVTAKHLAENIWLWGIEMVQAVNRNDTDRVLELSNAVDLANSQLRRVTARATKGAAPSRSL
jgi:hypothetical protein